ncbi:MAG: cupin domain-containing protein [Sphingobacteriia bacterium]|nr:cupin domain-containing protein [Sphingobacteriia bacterium]NCC40219.1 cupin domain-containing protein [Gammaproteobacteria bacterium]
MTDNLYDGLCELASGERFDLLLSCRNVLIERILSSARPDSRLYDQEQDEWVCLLRGEAQLWIDGATRRLCAGDHCFIPAHTPHRVLATSSEPSCLWLAVHIRSVESD